MSRIVDESNYSKSLYDLPIIDWSIVNAKAPTIIPFTTEGSYEILPEADIVVITWTSAEWSALDHVFLHSNETRSPYSETWRSSWREYKDSKNDTVLGYFALVEIDTPAGQKKVMVYKSECHLSHWPYYDGLMDMVDRIVDEAKPKQIYTIGTAGGATLTDNLGDVVVTNTGHAQLILKENKDAPCNNKTIEGKWYPSIFNQLDTIEEKLFIPLSDVLTPDEWDKLFAGFQKSNSGTEKMKLQEFINQPLEQQNIAHPKAKLQKGVPLLTTDYYYISGPEGNDDYCILEMDDTIIGYACQQKEVDFLCVRNVSDTVVVGEAGGQELTKDQRKGWSSAIYVKCGLYTSVNGALTTWSAITG